MHLALFEPRLHSSDALSAQRTADERFEARQDSARAAVNIDGEERRRRLVFGGALLVCY